MKSIGATFNEAETEAGVKIGIQQFHIKVSQLQSRLCIYFLGNKKEIRKFRSVMKHPEMKYPKNYKHDIEIRKIEVDDDKWKN